MLLNVMSSYIVVEDWTSEIFTKLIQGCYSNKKVTDALYEIKRVLSLSTDSSYSCENIERLLVTENHSEIAKYFIADINVHKQSNKYMCDLWKDAFLKCESMCRYIIDESTTNIQNIHKASSYLRCALPVINRNVDLEYKFARCKDGTLPTLDTSCLQTVNVCSSLLTDLTPLEQEVKKELSTISKHLIYEEVCIKTATRIIDEEQEKFTEEIKKKTLQICEDLRQQTLSYCRAKHFPMKEISLELKRKSQYELHNMRRASQDFDLSNNEKLLARCKINNDITTLKETISSILSTIDKCINVTSSDSKEINRKPWFAHIKLEAFKDPFQQFTPEVHLHDRSECSSRSKDLKHATLQNSSWLMNSSLRKESETSGGSFLGKSSNSISQCRLGDFEIRRPSRREDSSEASRPSKRENSSEASRASKRREDSSEASRASKVSVASRREDSSEASRASKVSAASRREDSSEASRASKVSAASERENSSSESSNIKEDQNAPKVRFDSNIEFKVDGEDNTDVNDDAVTSASLKVIRSGASTHTSVDEKENDLNTEERRDEGDEGDSVSDPESNASKSTAWQQVVTKLNSEGEGSEEENEIVPHPSWAHWMKT